jgi:cation diffusion facilitator family transporter
MRAAMVAIGANCGLLLLKAAATSLSDSLTIFSETLNSLSDCVASVVILLCVRWAWESPDQDHPFGHRRAEPVAGLVVAIFTGILGFEVCRRAVLNLWRGEMPTDINQYPMAALCITALVKAAMSVYFSRRAGKLNSPALRATSVDCRNDVLVAAQGLIGVVLAEHHLEFLDRVAALVVGAYILYSAHRIGIENLDYLMGKAPDEKLMTQIRTAAERVPSVHEVDHVKGHFVGTFVHVELTARVDGLLSVADSHEVAEAVRASVEAIDIVDRAFVHIEPFVAPADPARASPTPLLRD